MFPSQRVGYEPQLIIDYLSPHGPTVTAVRAIMLQGALKQLQAAGHYDDFSARFPQSHAATLGEALASSWVPVDVYLSYLETLDSMPLSDAQISNVTERLGAELFDQLFATIVRAVRAAGAGAGIWFGFKQADRVLSRMFHGGTCKIFQVGPKDAHYEISGLPGADWRCSRLSHCSFFRGVLGITARTCVVKVVPAREPRPDRLTLAISWV
jgi:hypothetical protein